MYCIPQIRLLRPPKLSNLFAPCQEYCHIYVTCCLPLRMHPVIWSPTIVIRTLVCWRGCSFVVCTRMSPRHRSEAHKSQWLVFSSLKIPFSQNPHHREDRCPLTRFGPTARFRLQFCRRPPLSSHNPPLGQLTNTISTSGKLKQAYRALRLWKKPPGT